MILEMTYDCGCVMSRMRESERFELKKPCPEHGGQLSSAARGANTDLYGQLDEVPGKPMVNLSKTSFAAQVAREAGVEQLPPVHLPDIGMLARPQAPAGDISDVGDIVVSCYVWGRLQRLLDTLKKNCIEGDSEYSQIGAVQDLLWRCAHGRAAVTQRVTPKSNNERDSEWRSALREAIKQVADKEGFTPKPFDPSGPAMYTLRDMLVWILFEGRKAAAENVANGLRAMAMGHKP